MTPNQAPASSPPDWAPDFLREEGGLEVNPGKYAGLLDAGRPEPVQPSAWHETDSSPTDEAAAGQKPQRKRTLVRVFLVGGILAALGVAGYRLWAPRPKAGPEPVPQGPVAEKIPAPRADTPEVVVSAQGDGHYTTLGEAVRKAEPGTRIRVKPGLYRGGVALDKQLEIVGEGPVKEIVLESTGYPCIEMQTEQAVVRGLTLRTRAGVFGSAFPTVNVPRGRLVLEGCDITSDAQACVSISGAATEPVLRSCMIHDGKTAGVFFWDGGKGRVEDCDVYGHTGSGLVIRSGSHPVIRGCRFHDNKLCGVEVFGKGGGELDDCRIFANAAPGVAIFSDSNPVFRNCRLEAGKDCGLLVTTKGKGELVGCHILGNTLSGVVIRNEGDPLLRDCRIAYGKDAGVYVRDRGLGRFVACTISGNVYAEVVVRAAGQPRFDGCTFEKGKGKGILIQDKGRATLTGCAILDNAQEGVLISQGDNPTLRKCRLQGNGKQGVVIQDRSKATVQECDLRENKGGPGRVLPSCTVTEAGNTPALRPAS